jgi:hypothetical protein
VAGAGEAAVTSAAPVSAWPQANAAALARVRSWAPALINAGYLVAAVIVTWRLWAHPASTTVAGNPADADQFAWFLRYSAAAISGGHLPALVTASMNAPRGISMMWNNSLLLPGCLLTPVTLLFGPQASLTVLLTAGFAGSAASMFWVLRRWQLSLPAAAVAGAVYGFSPAVLQSAIGHYNLQLAVLPPLIIHVALRICAGSSRPLRTGPLLGLLAAMQLFISAEILLDTAMAGLLIVVVLAASRPGAARHHARHAIAGLTAAAGTTAILAGWPLWAQFFGPLSQHGSAFLFDFYKNDLTSFITPSSLLLFHTSASAAAAARYQGGAPEYLGYLGVPLILVLAAAAIACWRQPAVRALAVTFGVLEVLSLGMHPLVGGTEYPGVALPWGWLAHLPVLSAALPDRLSIVADGAAAALLAFGIDAARSRMTRRGLAPIVTAAAVLAAAPLLPLPLPSLSVAAAPTGWNAAFTALRLAPGARLLVVPVPTATVTAALRWQADTGERISLIGGYFQGPASDGQVYVEGNGLPALAYYLDSLWVPGPAVPPLGAGQAAAALAYWRPAAVLADVGSRIRLRRYLEQLFGTPTVSYDGVLGWRRPHLR